MKSVTKLLADTALGCVLSPWSRSPSLSAPKNNIKNTPSSVSPRFMDAASDVKEAFWFGFLLFLVS